MYLIGQETSGSKRGNYIKQEGNYYGENPHIGKETMGKILIGIFSTKIERDKKYNELKISFALTDAHKIIGDALENLQMYAMIVQNSPNKAQLPTIMLAIQELDKFLVDNFTKVDDYTFKLSSFKLDNEDSMALHFAGVDTHITFDNVADTLKNEVIKLYHNHTMALKQAKKVVLSDEAIKILVRDNFVDDEPKIQIK